jgi:BirA family biotin operon repressor/biotin-[acetyl-CoA-carboxylase] ligase
MDSFIQSLSEILNLAGSCMQITTHTPTVLGVGTLRRPLDALRINSALGDCYWRVSVVDITGSTQNDLATEVRNGNSRDRDVLIAEFQSAGRGRLDRRFFAPERSALLFSFFVRPLRDSADWGWLPLLAGQAVATAIETHCNLGHILKLKWPNDILMDEKKVAGILSERVDSPDGPGIIIGIGINVDIRQDELPVTTATSLYLQGCIECNRDDLLVTVLRNFSRYLRRWESKDGELLQEYKVASATIGQRLRIEPQVGAIRESMAVGIDPSGALILSNGEHLTVGD